MDLKKELLNYKNVIQMEPQEKNIQETIRKSKEMFYKAEQQKMLSYQEFLWEQFKLIQKKWWLFQFLLLFVFGEIFVSSYEENYVQRGMGVLAVLFVILIIPELWKNRSNQSMEIEEAAYYSLRQIYAARMVLFGIVDILLLTAFCGTMTMGWHIAFTRVLVEFLLPMIVAACICFGTLCSKYIANETVAIFVCVLWCVVWLTITLNEKIYDMVSMPIWIACIVFALIFLCATVWRDLNSANDYWEVDFNGIRIE